MEDQQSPTDVVHPPDMEVAGQDLDPDPEDVVTGGGQGAIPAADPGPAADPDPTAVAAAGVAAETDAAPLDPSPGLAALLALRGRGRMTTHRITGTELCRKLCRVASVLAKW